MIKFKNALIREVDMIQYSKMRKTSMNEVPQ